MARSHFLSGGATHQGAPNAYCTVIVRVSYGYGYTRGSGRVWVEIFDAGRVRVRVTYSATGTGRVAEMVDPHTPSQLLLITNRRSHTGFRLIPTATTLNSVIALILRFFRRIRLLCSLQADYVTINQSNRIYSAPPTVDRGRST